MEIKIPKTVSIECPACDNTGHYTDENEIATCATCGLELHKDELVQANRAKIIKKINPEKIKKDIVKELQKSLKKSFKNFK